MFSLSLFWHFTKTGQKSPCNFSHNIVTFAIKMNLIIQLSDNDIDHDYNDVN